MRGPTLPGFVTCSGLTAPEIAAIQSVAWRDLYPEKYNPRGHLRVDIYISSVTQTLPQLFAARFFPPDGAKPIRPGASAPIRLYDLIPLLGDAVTVKGLTWPLTDRGAPYVLQAANITPGGNAQQWQLTVIPSASFVPQPITDRPIWVIMLFIARR